MFDRVLRLDDAILLAAKIKILPKNLNLEEGAHTAILEGSISEKMLHQVAADDKYSQVLWDKCHRNRDKLFKLVFGKDQAKEYSLKNENTAKDPGERMYLDISSIKDESLDGRRHWAILVDEATRWKHSFFLKKK